MRGADKYLIIFAVAIIVLVVAALIFSAQQPEPTYRDGESAEDIVYDYLFALHRGEYERAYSYLSPELPGYPADLQAFVRDTNQMYPNASDDNRNQTVTIVSSRETDDLAWVVARRTGASRGGMFGPSLNEYEFEMILEELPDGWKIVGGDQYFYYCWGEDDCR